MIKYIDIGLFTLSLSPFLSHVKRVLEQAWALLALLPTNERLLGTIKDCAAGAGGVDWNSILPLDSTMRLLYSMQIVGDLVFAAPLPAMQGNTGNGIHGHGIHGHGIHGHGIHGHGT